MVVADTRRESRSQSGQICFPVRLDLFSEEQQFDIFDFAGQYSGYFIATPSQVY